MDSSSPFRTEIYFSQSCVSDFFDYHWNDWNFFSDCWNWNGLLQDKVHTCSSGNGLLLPTEIPFGSEFESFFINHSRDSRHFFAVQQGYYVVQSELFFRFYSKYQLRKPIKLNSLIFLKKLAIFLLIRTGMKISKVFLRFSNIYSAVLHAYFN